MCGKRLKLCLLPLVLLLFSSLPLYSVSENPNECEALLIECVTRLEAQMNETENVLNVNNRLQNLTDEQQKLLAEQKSLNENLMQFVEKQQQQLQTRDEQLNQTLTLFNEYESEVSRQKILNRVIYGASGLTVGALIGLLIGGLLL